jgi:hypothetical protein
MPPTTIAVTAPGDETSRATPVGTPRARVRASLTATDEEPGTTIVPRSIPAHRDLGRQLDLLIRRPR